MTRIVLEPGQKIEICFSEPDGRVLKNESILVNYFPTFTPEVQLEKFNGRTGRQQRLIEVEIDE